MNWKTKAWFFRLFSVVPFGGQLHYFAQRHITRTLPRPVYPVLDTTSHYLRHVNSLRNTYASLANKCLFEFGAGWDLFENLVFYCYGIDRKYCYDLNRHAKRELINYCIDTLAENPPSGCVRRPLQNVGVDLNADLEKHYGISYCAPADARRTGLPPGRIDMVASTSTLEHIPEQDIVAILRECKNICSPDAVLSFSIDYSDHYQHSDQGIFPYNFLNFTDAEWESYNPPNHFQNRLRPIDYRQLFLDPGFRI